MQTITTQTQRELVHLSNGMAVTDSLAIAAGFKRAHKNVLQSLDKLINEGIINRLEFKPVEFTDAKGEQRRMIELTERGALIAMPFIGGAQSKLGQVKLVTAFLSLRDEHAIQAPWIQSRKAAATSYLTMCEALKETRAAIGKQTQHFHYSNEAKMINKALFGEFVAIDRSTLSIVQCTLLDRMEYKNAILISTGQSFDDRRAYLINYATTLKVDQAAISDEVTKC